METIAAVVTTYYRNEHLPRAIESLLESEDVSVEVYVVDMSCERHAEPVAREYDANYVPILSYDTDHTLEQIAKARDIGVAVSDEEYVFFLDDDDLVSEDGLSKLLDLLDGPCGVAFGIPDSLLTLELIRPYYAMDNPIDRDDLRAFILGLLSTPLSTAAMLIERETIESIPPIADLPHDDIATVFELTLVTEIATLDELTVSTQRDSHGAGISPESLEGQAKVFTEYNEYYDDIPEKYTSDGQYDRSRAEHHRYMGMAALRYQSWSFDAIRHYFKSAWIRPGLNVFSYAQCAAALFGKPGVDTLRRLLGRKII